MLTKPNTPKTKYAFLAILAIIFTFFLAAKPSEVKAQTNATDQAALVDLYNATNGAAWGNNIGWLVGDASGWTGITVDGSNRVTEINLPSNFMAGSLPASIGDLDALEVLDLSDNAITGSIPVEIGNLTALTTLNLGGNQLTGELPTEIGNLTALVDLQLWNNFLSGPLPTSIGDLTNLTYLDLAPNQFSGNIPTEIGSLVSLGTLWLNNNLFDGAVPTSLANLTLLTELYLQGNSLTDLPDLSSLTGLTTFNVADNFFEFDDILPNLAIAGISYSPQKDFPVTPSYYALSIGDPLNLSASFVGASVYSWQKNLVDISGAVSTSFSIPSLALPDADSYRLTATNPSVAGLTLATEPIIVDVLQEAVFEIVNNSAINLDIPGESYGGYWADYDLDGDEDLYVNQYFASPFPNFFYENNGDGTFTKITSGGIVNDLVSYRSASWGDINNDGYPDLFTPNYLPDYSAKIYRNNTDKTFTTQSIPLLDGTSAGGVWGDYDQDGFLDLVIFGSFGTKLYRNNGASGFDEVTSPFVNFNSWQASFVDIDNDGDQDLYQTTEGSPYKAELIRNNGDGTFTAVADALMTTDAIFNRGAIWADYDNDGDEDMLALSLNAGSGTTTFYVNNGTGVFTARADTEAFSTTVFGRTGTAGDFDNDGDLDLIIKTASGTVDFYQNDGGLNFTFRTDQTFNASEVASSVSNADYDNDGDLDLFIGSFSLTRSNYLYKNVGNSNNWLKIKLEGTSSNRLGIGARVTLTYTNGIQSRQIKTSSAISSQNSMIQHFGLGVQTSVTSIRVDWPSGAVDVISNPGINQLLTLEEGSSTPTGLIAATSSVNTIELKWNPYSYSSGGDFWLERAESEAGPYLVVGIVKDTLSNYSDVGLFSNSVYYYRIKHVSGLTESAYSLIATAATFSTGLPDTWIIQQALTTPGRLTLLDMAVDDLGNTYLAGNFAGTLFLNGDSIYSNGANDAIVIKVNAAKAIEWIKTFGSPAVDLAVDVAVGPGGSVYVGGYHRGAFTVDSQAAPAPVGGAQDGYVARLSPDGTVVWITTLGSPADATVNKLAVDAAGNAYLAGYFNGDFTFGTSAPTGGGPGFFKVGPDGSKIFARFGTLVGNTRFANSFNTVAVSGNNVYVSGEVDGQWSFEGTSIAPNALRDAVLIKYGTDGSLKWVKTLAGPGEDYTSEVAVDAAGNVFWAGDFDGATATVDAVTLSNQGAQSDIFLAKINGANGTVLWGKSAGTANEDDTPMSLSTDGSSFFMAGWMGYGATNFDAATLTNGKLFLVSYDTDGSVRWVDKSEGSFGLPWGLEYSKLDGGLLMTGSFEYTQRFGAIDLISSGSRNGFLSFHNDSDLPIAPQIDSADVAAIVKLYDSTGGDNWINKTNWKSALPVGFWHGIEVSNGRVVTISLPGNNLIGEIPEEIFAMDSLKTLVLGLNALTGALPATIPGLRKLEQLYLNDNQFTGEIPESIGSLLSLNALDLGRNELVGALPASIGNLINLSDLLGVAGNQLEGEIPLSIGNLRKLKTLALDANNFDGSIPAEISNLAALEALYLHQNSLTGPLPDSIVNLKRLKSVYLSNNQLEGSVPAGVAAMDSLQTLIIQQNQFTFVPNLTGLTKLDTLNISNNKVGFGSIEPNLGVNGFVYSPQGRFGLAVDTLHSAGDAFLFELEIGGSTNSYQWFKDDVEITGATEQDYFIASAGETDEGIYFARVANASVPDLILDTDEYVFKISSRKRDSLALVAIYEGTGGPNWVNKTNWFNGDISTWGGITFENGRVRQIVLPNNRIVGPMPAAIRDIGELALIDFSNSGSTFDANVDNQIRFLPDLRRLNSLTSVNMTRNRLGFVSIETNLAALGDKFLFSPQRRFGETRYDSVPVGQAHKVAIEVSGLTNSYQWYFNDQPIEGATKRFHIIDNVTYDKMGAYFVEVKSPKVPDFSIRNRNQNVLATTTISGSINSAFDQSPLTSGVAIVYKIKDGPYDSIAAAQVSPEGAFIAEKIVLGDYIIIAKPDLELFPDALQTYYSSTIDWVQADTLRVRNPVAGLTIALLGTPPPLNGDGVIGGSLESDLPDDSIPDEEARILDRKRVAGAGVSLSRQRFRAKGNEFDYDFVAYTVTDEEGNFSFGTLTDDTYLINIQYPGVPMDQSSDILLTLGTQTDFNKISVEALVKPEGIVVKEVASTGVKAPFLRDLNVYPNPGDDIINLDYFVRRKVESLNMRVTDMTGRELMLQGLPYSHGPQRTAMDISGLTPGMYILVISDEAGSFTETWRIQKK
jgi:Leucine-rich repeat (LRR) protein